MTPYAISRIASPVLALAAVLASGLTTSAHAGPSGGAASAVPLGLGTDERPLEGFGADTRGGFGGSQYVVTTLADSGPGSLRDAVSSPRRRITFAVGGEIRLETTLRIGSPYLTIDGHNAPLPGITITAAGPSFAGPLVVLDGGLGAHDIIVRHLRFADDPDPSVGDNLRIQSGARNVVVDHCTLRHGGDGALDINNDVHDVTIQWCLIATTVKNQLIRTNVRNLSIHHNLYLAGDERNPQIDEVSGPVDFVNNVVYNWGHNYGTRIRGGSSGNLIKSIWLPGGNSDPSDAVIIGSDAGPVYSEGNVIPPASDDTGNWPTRLPAPPVTEMDPARALMAVLAEAGAQPRGREDILLLAQMSLTSSLSSEGPANEVVVSVEPNPVRGSAVIRYRLLGPGQVCLSVFDAAGRRIETVPLGSRDAGTHHFSWNASRLRPGVYVLRLRAGTQVATRKVLRIP